MSTPLRDIVAAELAASGLDQTELNPGDAAYVENGIRGVLSGLKARRAWENHIGAILTHKQVLEVTGWTKQALSQGFDGAAPARPILGVKDVLRVWADADGTGWMAASWMMTEQPELGGRTPRQALLDGDGPSVVDLAHAATGRLAA
ncbi:MAG: hypothetical protein EOP32_01020 [Rhodococcus sp. (in: high G+C Gram-positive bacteria)]|nr:MAG: hypothetical protein EOP32_01020 [Rhodococcus sp. (in: high G+C Gram-positive bacteria)]